MERTDGVNNDASRLTFGCGPGDFAYSHSSNFFLSRFLFEGSLTMQFSR